MTGKFSEHQSRIGKMTEHKTVALWATAELRSSRANMHKIAVVLVLNCDNEKSM